MLNDVEAVNAVRASTSSGDVIAHDVTAPSVDLATDFGVVRANGIRGALRAATRSGDVRLCRLGHLNFVFWICFVFRIS